MSQWISVLEQMPIDDQTVFGWYKGREAELPVICYYDEETNSFLVVINHFGHCLKLAGDALLRKVRKNVAVARFLD